MKNEKALQKPQGMKLKSEVGGQSDPLPFLPTVIMTVRFCLKDPKVFRRI
jgi:hypothetical protein